MSAAATTLLREWLGHRLDAPRLAWLDAQIASLQRAPGAADLAIGFGLVPRRIGNADLALTDTDRAAAGRALDGWTPHGWSVADAARILLLSTVSAASENFATTFRGLCVTADVAELTSLYRGLPLYAGPAALLDQVAEGLRSNMRSVFEAIVHHSPYPKTHFDEHRWNHMVLKALFVGSPLAPIQGLDARANAELARMLCDFAHERQAAGRTVPYAIWRCVGPFARGPALDDLARVLADRADSTGQRAAALALAACPEPRAAHLLQEAPALSAEISTRRLTWDTLQH